MKTSTTASTSTIARSRNDFCCSSIGAAVLHADRRRQVQVGDRLLHGGDAGAQIDAFEARGHLDVALQVLAPDFGLAGQLLDRRQRAERGGPPGRADEQRVADRFERRRASTRESARGACRGGR